MRIAILRCKNLPSFINWDVPKLDDYFAEDTQIIEAFQRHGVDARPVVWSDPEIEWPEFDAAIIRSTWDYLDHFDHFLKVLAEIEASGCKLFNPLEMVRWNIDKRYLIALGQEGVPTIPTYPVSGDGVADLVRAATRDAWSAAVIKPTVGLAGSKSHKVELLDLGDKVAELVASDPHSTYLAQPFAQAIVDEGEWSFVYIGREFSHAVLKTPAAGDFRVQSIYGGAVNAPVPTSEDRAQADAVIDHLPGDPLYARIDMVRRADGVLAVMEVELIEPVLYFSYAPQGIERIVRATKVRLGMA